MNAFPGAPPTASIIGRCRAIDLRVVDASMTLGG